MGQLSLTGSITAGPPSAGEGFPASQAVVPLGLRTTPKSFGVATGVLTRQLSSANAFATLTGVGASDTMTKADFLYLRTNAKVDLRLTIDNGSNGSDLRIVTVGGLVVMEFDSGRPLLALEAQGTATIEYLLSGQS